MSVVIVVIFSICHLAMGYPTYMIGVDSMRNNLVPVKFSDKEWESSMIGAHSGESFLSKDQDLIMTYANISNSHQGATQILVLDVETGKLKKVYSNFTNFPAWQGASMHGGLLPKSPNDNQYVVVNADNMLFTGFDLSTGQASQWAIKVPFVEELYRCVIYEDILVFLFEYGTRCSVWSTKIMTPSTPFVWELNNIPCSSSFIELTIVDGSVWLMDDSHGETNKLWKIDAKNGKFENVKFDENFYYGSQPISVSLLKGEERYYFIQQVKPSDDSNTEPILYVYAYDYNTDKQVWKKQIPQTPNGCTEPVISNDGKILSFLCASKIVSSFYLYAVDTKSGEFKFETNLETEDCRYVNILPNSKYFVSCSEELFSSSKDRKMRLQNRLRNSNDVDGHPGAFFVVDSSGKIEKKIGMKNGWTVMRPMIDLNNNVFFCYYTLAEDSGCENYCQKMNLA